MVSSYKYSIWDGTQEVEVTAEDILDAISEDLLERGDPRQALRRLMQRGMRDQNQMGLQQMMQRLRERRQQRLDQYDLGSFMDKFQEALDEILRLEREGIERRVEDARQRADAGDRDSQEPSAGDPSTDPANQQQPSPSQQWPGSPQAGQRSPGQQGQDDDIDPEQAQRLLEYLERSAQAKRDRLEQLPKDLGQALKGLQDYDFWDPEAKQKYDELMDQLKQQMAQNMMQSMMQNMQGMQGMSPEQMQGMRQMLQDLNQMLREMQKGGQPDFQQFMEKWGQNFGDNPPQSMEELLDQLNDRNQQMQSLMQSLSPDQRRQMQDLMESLYDEMGMQGEMQELAQHLSDMYPSDQRMDYPFRGDESLTMQEAMKLMDEMARMESLEQDLRAAQMAPEIPESTVQEVRELLGEEEAKQLENLRDLAKKLEDAGYVQRNGERLEITPRALRKIGQKALREVFDKLKKDRVGNHAMERRGSSGDRSDEAKRYEFGDPFLLDLERTVRNAIERQGAGVPIHLTPDDFEVYRTEHQTQCSTVLLLDQSRSMGYTGRWLAAKKVALALQSLIQNQFPRDQMSVIGFSAYATEIKRDELAKVTWSYESSGTNMHHALMLARQFLGRQKGGTKQVIMVTDGEPTAHLERGYAYFAYPPTHRTIRETLREVERCTREGIVINTFMLEQGYYLMEFVSQMAKLNGGRVFYSAPEKLGEYVLVDYLGQKKRNIR
ncbi:MAG: VWA domain-containing protein [Dehalococcoidia bacterium]|nr:VWA domain-containing protein [Dehalococcoidia bacterium]